MPLKCATKKLQIVVEITNANLNCGGNESAAIAEMPLPQLAPDARHDSSRMFSTCTLDTVDPNMLIAAMAIQVAAVEQRAIKSKHYS